MRVRNVTKVKAVIFLLLPGSVFIHGCASPPPAKSTSHLKLETITNDGRVNYVFRSVPN